MFFVKKVKRQYAFDPSPSFDAIVLISASLRVPVCSRSQEVPNEGGRIGPSGCGVEAGF